MSHTYRMVQWNRHKIVYDLILALAVVLLLGAFSIGTAIGMPQGEGLTAAQLIIRATAFAAFALLHVILCIGPLARLDRRFLPFLYNRRHLGVTFFFLALVHAIVVTLWYHGFGSVNPFISLLTSNTRVDSFQAFPFEWLGMIGLGIFFVMAATSHDFWLANLGPRFWKTLHMFVYLGYALIVMHVMLGIVQSETDPIYAILTALGAVVVSCLHLVAGTRQTQEDKETLAVEEWVPFCNVNEIEDDRAKVARLNNGRSVAVFKHAGKLSAISNSCAHQGGPLGEGKVIDGCITCPWHGYQYRPQDGQSPPPYTEKLPTYRLRLNGSVVELNPEPLPAGTVVEPVTIHSQEAKS